MSRLPAVSDILGQNYDQLPRECQLLLVTSVIGTTPTWLIHTFVQQALSENTPIILVSFMEKYEYYRDGMKKLGISINSNEKSKFTFIDGLSSLFDKVDISRSSPISTSSQRVPAFGPGNPKGVPQPSSLNSNIPQHNSSSNNNTLLRIDQTPSAQAKNNQLLPIQNAIEQAIKASSNSSSKPLVILLNPDFLLAAAELHPTQLLDFVQDIQALSSCLIAHVQSDSVLSSPHSMSALETNHTTTVTSLAHMAHAVLALRLLDTGVAKDVSGVVRVTNGGCGDEQVEERERLYFVTDTNVKIFARGEGGS